MKIIRSGWLAIALVWLALPTLAGELRAIDRPEDIGFAGDRLKRLTEAFQGYVDSGKLPGAVVLIARNDKIAYFHAFGYQDREQQIAMRADSIFRLASMTK